MTMIKPKGFFAVITGPNGDIEATGHCIEFTDQDGLLPEDQAEDEASRSAMLELCDSLLPNFSNISRSDVESIWGIARNNGYLLSTFEIGGEGEK